MGIRNGAEKRSQAQASECPVCPDVPALAVWLYSPKKQKNSYRPSLGWGQTNVPSQDQKPAPEFPFPTAASQCRPLSRQHHTMGMAHQDKKLPKPAEKMTPGPLVSPSEHRENPYISKKPREGSPGEGRILADNTCHCHKLHQRPLAIAREVSKPW